MSYFLAALQTFVAPNTLTSSYFFAGKTLSLCSAARLIIHFDPSILLSDSGETTSKCS